MPGDDNNKDTRASHADRDQVIDGLKAAFVQGRLTKDELLTRSEQAFSARTCADLAALTADLPADPSPARQPVPAPPQPGAHLSIKVGAGLIALMVTAFIVLVMLNDVPLAALFVAPVLVLFLGAPAAIVVSLAIAAALKLEARRRKTPRRSITTGDPA